MQRKWVRLNGYGQFWVYKDLEYSIFGQKNAKNEGKMEKSSQTLAENKIGNKKI